jgi:hypothetical protein
LLLLLAHQQHLASCPSQSSAAASAIIMRLTLADEGSPHTYAVPLSLVAPTILTPSHTRPIRDCNGKNARWIVRRRRAALGLTIIRRGIQEHRARNHFLPHAHPASAPLGICTSFRSQQRLGLLLAATLPITKKCCSRPLVSSL